MLFCLSFKISQTAKLLRGAYSERGGFVTSHIESEKPSKQLSQTIFTFFCTLFESVVFLSYKYSKMK